MNFIRFIILFIIFGCYILSFNPTAAWPNFAPFAGERKLSRNVRQATTVKISIICNNSTDCSSLSSTIQYVCVQIPSLTVGICIPDSPTNIATNRINGKNIVYAFILSSLVLIIN